MKSGAFKLLVVAIAVAIAVPVGLLLFASYSAVDNGGDRASPTDSQQSSGGKLVVVAFISPISNIVRNVAGDRVTFVTLIPESVDSHIFKLSVTEGVIMRTRAEIVIINGLGLEPTI